MSEQYGIMNDGAFPVPQSRPIGSSSSDVSSAASFLPPTAPVSSLLPPIPTTHQHHQQQALIAAAVAAQQTQQQQHAAAAAAAFLAVNHHPSAASIQAQLAAFLTQGLAAAASAAAANGQLQQQQPQHVVANTIPNTMSMNPTTNASNSSNAPTAAQILASSSVAAAANPLLPSNVNMHGWSVDQIESHIKLLKQMKQHVPQNVTMLLHEAKKRTEKRHAKRIANRKSACSSRARKKALVQEMTALNTRLRRQALILSLLPDLVIVVDVEGSITFCSAQVERVLLHSIDDLVGAKLTDIVAPHSRKKLNNFIQDLLSPPNGNATVVHENGTLVASKEEKGISSHVKSNKKAKIKNDMEDLDRLTADGSANAVTDSSFPLTEVQVDGTAPASSDENDNSDECKSKQPSSLTTISFAGNSGSDGGKKSGIASASSSVNRKKLSSQGNQSSDSSNTSSNTEFSDAKNLLSANTNLERNVRWHNKKIMKDKRDGYKDDVLGSAVTANNASARLSSLCHRTSDSEEDSGYRESNDSREETSSSEGEASSKSKEGRRKPIAPTCNVCLIREDLTTIWCEVTSSVRTKTVEDDTDETCSLSNSNVNKQQSSTMSTDEPDTRKRGRSEEGSCRGSEDIVQNENSDSSQGKEILLCLRPIRNGDEKPDESLRFKPMRHNDKRMVSEENSGEECDVSPVDGFSTEMPCASPSSKNDKDKSQPRRLSKKHVSTPSKRNNRSAEEDVDHAVVESLMSMSSQKEK